MRITPFLPGLCALGMAMIFVFLGFSAKRQNAMLERKGITYSGSITKAEVQKGSKGKKRYVVWVTWGEGDGIKTDDSFVVTKSFFEGHMGSDEVADDASVTIRTLPEKPGSAVLVGGTSDLSGMENLGYVFVVIGGILLFRASRRLARQRA